MAMRMNSNTTSNADDGGIVFIEGSSVDNSQEQVSTSFIDPKNFDAMAGKDMALDVDISNIQANSNQAQSPMADSNADSAVAKPTIVIDSVLTSGRDQ